MTEVLEEPIEALELAFFAQSGITGELSITGVLILRCVINFYTHKTQNMGSLKVYWTIKGGNHVHVEKFYIEPLRVLPEVQPKNP